MPRSSARSSGSAQIICSTAVAARTQSKDAPGTCSPASGPDAIGGAIAAAVIASNPKIPPICRPPDRKGCARPLPQSSRRLREAIEAGAGTWQLHPAHFPWGRKVVKALIIVMLCVQVGIFLATAATILTARSTAERPRPLWSGLAISLIVVAGTSWRIAEGHAGEPGADIATYCSPLLVGMGLMAAMLAI